MRKNLKTVCTLYNVVHIEVRGKVILRKSHIITTRSVYTLQHYSVNVYCKVKKFNVSMFKASVDILAILILKI